MFEVQLNTYFRLCLDLWIEDFKRYQKEEGNRISFLCKTHSKPPFLRLRSERESEGIWGTTFIGNMHIFCSDLFLLSNFDKILIHFIISCDIDMKDKYFWIIHKRSRLSKPCCMRNDVTSLCPAGIWVQRAHASKHAPVIKLLAFANTWKKSLRHLGSKTTAVKRNLPEFWSLQQKTNYF